MHLNFRTFFGDHRPIIVLEKTAPQTAPTSIPINVVQPKPRVMLCAPPGVREKLAHSKVYEFIPHGKVDPIILKGVKQSSIDGILIHFEMGEAEIKLLMGMAAKDFPDLPCHVLCSHYNNAEITRYGWQTIAVRDMTSVSEIEEKLQRALFLFPLMKREALRRTLGVLKTIPTEAASHQRIVRELQNPQFSLDDVTGLIKKDPALTVQLLKIVNSAAFLRGALVQNVDEAVAILGTSKLQALIASAWAFFLIDDNACEGFRPKDEWAHAVKIAERVRKICDQEHINSKTAETAIIAAMLHDLGKLLLAANLPHDYAVVLKNAEMEKRPIWQMENQLLGFNHAEVAGCLLALWGVPISVAEAVVLHHSDGLLPETSAALIQKAHVVDMNIAN